MREQQATEQRLAETKFAKEMQAMTLQKQRVRDLQAQLNAGAMQRQLAVNEAVSSVEKQGIAPKRPERSGTEASTGITITEGAL